MLQNSSKMGWGSSSPLPTLMPPHQLPDRLLMSHPCLRPSREHRSSFTDLVPHAGWGCDLPVVRVLLSSALRAVCLHWSLPCLSY